jgi:hypothetical protein
MDDAALGGSTAPVPGVDGPAALDGQFKKVAMTCDGMFFELSLCIVHLM